MANSGSRVLSKMLDRLLAGLMSGPNMNCRPQKSRQRVDLSQLIRLADITPDDLLRSVLGADRTSKAVARVKMPKKMSRSPATSDPQPETEPKSPGEKAWIEQSALLNKLRVIADDARTYENDTGVHALSIGFPLLSLPPGSFGGGARPGTKRILAPIAFIPVTLTLKGGATPSVEIACHNEGADRVRANPALLSWLEQQTGNPMNTELFEDEEGSDPWREITQLVEHAAIAAGVEIPEIFKLLMPSPGSSGEEECSTPDAQLSTRNEENKETSSLNVERRELSVERSPDRTEDPPTLEMPKSLALQPALRGDEENAQPEILISAVLGLFPTAHQGLVRDTRAMIAESAAGTTFPGPIQSFLSAGIDFDAISVRDVPVAAAQANPQRRSLSSERLAAAADPCQAKAVALARESAALVVHGPPGTGKSQTITNIIADHLSRGQRVLLVCEKRTALDVVADRLEHMGLRSFCGIVHDPQRDQRDLYRSIRQQLDDLPESKTYPKAEAALAKVDAELQQLHDELTGFHQSLMDSHPSGGPSFHELMGQWMAARPDTTVRLGDTATAGIHLDDLDNQRAAMTDLFRRARSVDFSRNLWAKCAGVSLADFLSQPMESVRTSLDRCNAAASAADGKAAVNIPPFNDKAPLALQGKAREELSGRLRLREPGDVIREAATGQDDGMLREVQDWGFAGWVDQDTAAVRSQLRRLSVEEEIAKKVAAAPLDSELQHLINPTWTDSQIAQDEIPLDEYLAIAKKWWSIFSFGIKKKAKNTLQKYGLPLTPTEADRLQTFLIGLQNRLALSRFCSEAKMPASAPIVTDQLPADEELLRRFSTARRWLELLLQLREDPAFDGVAPLLAAAMKSEAATSEFLDGLEKSPARAEALVRLDEELTKSDLLDHDWLVDFESQLRQGKLAGDTTAALAAQIDSLEGVLRVRAGRTAMPDKMQPVVDLMLSQLVDADAAMAAVQTSVVANEIRSRLRNDTRLHSIDAHHVESAFDRFRELDAQKKTLVRDFVAHQWISKQQERLLAATGTRLNALGAALRQRLLMRGEHAIRLRQVIARGENIDGGDPLFDLCPVWMASPETVAQIFPRKAMFDVIVFDEASQCRLEEALPVLTRGRRVVIAGDPHQLPPTRFFESGLVQSEEDEPETEQELFESQQGEIEDLLAAALNLAIQQSYLDVHYRSRNSDLIEFSNSHFYASRLQAIPAHPANRSKLSPITLHRVQGVYSKRRNEAEADRVVAIVKDLLTRAEPPSIGIACLNLPQRDLVVEKLDDLAAEDAAFGKSLAAARTRKGEGSFDGLFVKNLENVQGDERDDIIISTTYGPDTNGKFYRRFGPLGMAGGGRRLNVLVTRARSKVHLVTSIPVEAYRTLPPIPDGQAATGAWLLFAYLRYAETLSRAYENANIEHPASNVEHQNESEEGQVVEQGILNVERLNSGAQLSNDSPAQVNIHPSRSPSLFSKEMAESLASVHRLGSDVHWGNEGFCVDLAMHDPADPGEITVGVLCDGCRYTAAADPVEWDIFRTGILQEQGWTLQRIWTPHYFRDPEGNAKQIATAAASYKPT